MAKNINIAKIFGVEDMVTIKTLVTETKEDVRRKTPDECKRDIKSLLDEIDIRIASQDIIGVVDCLKAVTLRTEYMMSVAEELRKAMGK